MVPLLILVFGCLVLSASYASADCGKDEFPCNDGSCVEKTKWCDTIEHCRDDSDELYCFKGSLKYPNPNRCNSTFFRCLDGPCIPLEGRCDGYASCHDLSDEANCSTPYPTTDLPRSETAFLHTETIEISERPTTEFEMSTRFHLESESGAETTVQESSAYTTEMASPVYSKSVTTSFVEPLVQTEIYDVPQSDTQSKPVEKTFKDITKGFKKLDVRAFSKWKDMAQKWILSVRDEDYGWGDETARAITALHMSYDTIKHTEEKLLMSKQLHLKISVALIRNQTEKIPLSELSLYLNALLASCDNPRNFYGNDLVSILRHRTNAAQVSAEFVSPLVYLTLCLSNASTFADAHKIQEAFIGQRPEADRIGIQALATLAAICTSNIPTFTSTQLGQKLAKRLYDKISSQGHPENIYELALTVQALNEASVNQDLWKRSNILNRIGELQESDGSWSDILGTYYVLPILSGKSLLSLSNNCYPPAEIGMTPVDVIMNSKDDKIPVTYSLYFGEPMAVSQSLRIRVSKSANLLDVMRIAERENPVYRFKYDMARGKPSVYSIGGIANDAEQGLYWMLHLSQRNATKGTNQETLSKFQGDIRSYLANSSDHIVFWLKKLH